MQRLEQAAQVYQARLNATPAVEAEMGDMMRDFGNMKKEYQRTAGQEAESALATSLESSSRARSSASSIRPVLPDKPSFPDRFKFSLGAIGVGLALAVLFGFGSEFLDDRIRSEQALSEAMSLPILCEIPPLPTPRRIRRARWKPWLAVAAARCSGSCCPRALPTPTYWG